MGKRDNAGYLCAVIAVTVLILQEIYYQNGFAYTNPDYFFVLVILIGAATLYTVFFLSSKRFLVCFMILATALFMNLTYVYYSASLPYIPPLDAIFHWKTAEGITTSGSINIVQTSNIEFEYSSFPGFHLFISMASQITGIDSVTFVKFIPLLYSLLPFLVFIITRRIFPSSGVTAGLAAYVTIFLPKWYAFPSYSRFVIIYFLLLIFFMIELTRSLRKESFIVALLSIFALSITHHIMTYISVFFILFTMALGPVVKQLKLKGLPIFKNADPSMVSFRALACLLVGAILFPILGSPASFEYHFRSFLKYFSPSYHPEDFSRSIMGFYTSTEQIFIFAAIGLVGLVGFIGLIKYLRHDKWVVTTVAFTVFFGAVFVLSLPTLYTNSTVYNYVSGRLTFILFIAIAPFVGMVLAVRNHASRRRIRILAATLLLLSLTFASVDLIPRGYIYFSQEKSVSNLWEVRDNANSLYSSLLWMKGNGATSTGSAVGDVPLNYLGKGMLSLNMTEYWPLFEDPVNGDAHFRELTGMGVKYVFVDTLLTTYTEQTDFKMFIGPMPASNLTQVQDVPWANRIYDDGTIDILALH